MYERHMFHDIGFLKYTKQEVIKELCEAKLTREQFDRDMDKLMRQQVDARALARSNDQNVVRATEALDEADKVFSKAGDALSTAEQARAVNRRQLDEAESQKEASKTQSNSIAREIKKLNRHWDRSQSGQRRLQ